MTEDPRTGRTVWDFATGLFASPIAVAVAFAAVVVIVLFVHFQAEPGAEISFLGLLKYQKAKPPSVSDGVQSVSQGSIPSINTTLFSWHQSDDKCKVRAAEAIREAGGGNVYVDKFSTMGSKNQNSITILCNAPHYAVIVAGLDGESARDLRDSITAILER